jgi:hypothetical protein
MIWSQVVAAQVRNLVNSYARKQEAMRTYEFLLAAAAGDLQGLRNLIAQGKAGGLQGGVGLGEQQFL